MNDVCAFAVGAALWLAVQTDRLNEWTDKVLTSLQAALEDLAWAINDRGGYS